MTDSRESDVVYLVKRKRKKFRCMRCGHEWTPQNEKRPPTKCTSCFNPYWKKPVGVKKEYIEDYLVTREVQMWQCQICENEWEARDVEKPPVKCPKCSNPNWRKERS